LIRNNNRERKKVMKNETLQKRILLKRIKSGELVSHSGRQNEESKNEGDYPSSNDFIGVKSELKDIID